jgi:hypothetical protein
MLLHFLNKEWTLCIRHPFPTDNSKMCFLESQVEFHLQIQEHNPFLAQSANVHYNP